MMYEDMKSEIYLAGPVVDHPEAVITTVRSKFQPACPSLHSKGWVIKECILQKTESQEMLIYLIVSLSVYSVQNWLEHSKRALRAVKAESR